MGSLLDSQKPIFIRTNCQYYILVHTFRNRIEHFEDDVIGICAGLWNLVLSAPFKLQLTLSAQTLTGLGWRLKAESS